MGRTGVLPSRDLQTGVLPDVGTALDSVLQRIGLGGILLSLHQQPALIAGIGEHLEYGIEVHVAVTGDGESTDLANHYQIDNTSSALLTETADAGAEYLDCYNAGIPAAVWAAAGLTERREDDGVIIPNYLTPPLQQNTEYYYFTNQPDGFVLFKADGDQDRPNLPCD